MVNGHWKIINNMDLSALHQYLITKNEVNKLLVIFEKLTSELFKQNFNLNDFLADETSYELSLQIKNLLKANKLSEDADRNQLGTFFSDLEKQISSLPVIHLMLAFKPKSEVLLTIHDWFYQNYQKIVLLDISSDESIIGGSVISFKGRANDYSLKNQIDQMV